MKPIIRRQFELLQRRLREPRAFIQILSGPRQVGKTTLITQLQEKGEFSVLYALADEPTLKSNLWIEQQWSQARTQLVQNPNTVLVIDEIQKIEEWSETVKRLWDEDTRKKNLLKVVLLGSSRLVIQEGLSESLAGRFEVISVSHWTFWEMKEAFGLSFEEYCFFGGYPGAAPLIRDEARWKRYILDSMIETTLSKDILMLNRIEKPALLRRLFYLACDSSSKILSFQKMLGQLADSGNTTTMAHYLEVLGNAGLVIGLQKFANTAFRQKASSPKLQVFNSALKSALSDFSFPEAKASSAEWGFWVESAVGADLLCRADYLGFEVHYWREKNLEVDFVVKRGRQILAIEVKSGRAKDTKSGLVAFKKLFPRAETLVIGGSDGLPLESALEQLFPMDV